MTNRTEYGLYHKAFEGKEDRIFKRENYLNFVNEYYKVIADFLVEYTGGVLIKNYMYIFMYMYPFDRVPRKAGRTFINFHSDHKVYTVSVVMNQRCKRFRVRRRSVEYELRSKLRDKIVEGVKYKTYFHTFKKGGFV